MGRKKTEDRPLERLLELIDEQVEKRGQAVLTVEDTSAEITRLASEARRQGATMKQLSERIKRMDVKTRKWAKRSDGKEGITRQALDTMLAVYEKRRAARTTRASRRRREASEPAAVGGTLNVEALQ